MLHLRASTYVTSLLLLIPSIIVTLRILESRKKQQADKPKERSRKRKDKSERAILKMSVAQGTCWPRLLYRRRQHKG